MVSRSSLGELIRIRAALIHSAELLAVESIAVALFTPISVATLLTRLAPIAERLRSLIHACDLAIVSFGAAETKLLGDFDRLSVSEIAAGSLVASGAFSTSAVWVKAVGGPQTVLAPNSLPDLASRLRVLSDERTPTVRIEKYAGPTGNRFVVYIPGTQNLGAVNGNPFDMRSNLQLMAGRPSASSRAVDLAIRKSGAEPGDRVMLVGYSQGGMVATQLAKQAKLNGLDYQVDQVVTFGSPVGSNSANSLPKVLSVENKVDFVPQLDAIDNPKGPNWLTLEGVAIGNPIQNHEMDSYQRIVDGFCSSRELASNPIMKNVESFATGSGTVSYLTLGQKAP